MINTRNVSDITALDSEPLTSDEIRREFSTGDISKIE